MTYVTKSNIPFPEAFLMPERFELLNMLDDIWYVDKEHPEWEKIKSTAIMVAKTMGDKEELTRLSNLK